MIEHFNIKITGEVQGVGFRCYTQKKAKELGIKGYVVNDPDGAVYVEAEGEEDALKEFVNWCRRGPDGVRVAKIEVIKGGIKEFTNFRISY
ncbi:acylphosphatase [Candidatus Falkowbacteria bacterium CG10_big_fil_rev_8_21_14_0_10_43_10]|uniref:acylphosphatase n=1 Tax=Candidatus Falkowbacteria bacterium CG10_big_fil_rev_8_21_14_0_10_43_10 TaxID=1974567 RepID=A0A2H0V1G6_9BACT|nr:MAG: acylphosphatase [Candidatus Falkowbacteria bacterium CG10_big_fil_rev_8_21_14_0_10_43_10]